MNMQNMEYLKYTPVQGEKYEGVATIRYEKRFIFRFKIVKSDRQGYYCQTASNKIIREGKESYVPAFSLDSSYEYDEMKAFVLSRSEQAMTQLQPSLSLPRQNKTIELSNFEQNQEDQIPF